VPAFALALVALLRVIDNACLTVAATLLFAAQFLLMTLQSFESNTPTWLVRSAYSGVPKPESSLAQEIARLVEVSCTAAPEGVYNSVVGNYTWLNKNTLVMLTAERFAVDGHDCGRDSTLLMTVSQAVGTSSPPGNRRFS
jgi:hypothetical protein